MDHGAVINSMYTTRKGRRMAAGLTLLALLTLPSTAVGAAATTTTTTTTTATPAVTTPATTPAVTSKATLVEPVDGKHFDHLELAPMVQFDPGKDVNGKAEQPKWVLLASDPGMTKTVRFCRQFVWASSGGGFHWGCNKWATGADQVGNDQLLALEADKVYYWQVVSKAATGDTELVSAVRSFAIDKKGDETTVGDIGDQVNGTVFGDGSNLNLGTAAYVNSGVKVQTIASSKLTVCAYRIKLSHVGDVNLTRSYIKVTSRAGTRYLKLVKSGEQGAGTVWKLNAAERRLKTKRYTYQAYIKSAKNGSMVRSQLRVVLIKAPKAPPKWKAD